MLNFLGLKFVSGLLFAALGFVLFVILLHQSLVIGLLLVAALGILGSYFPDLWLRSAMRTRQRLILRALPDALDLLTICVEAGLGFDAAMSLVGEKWDNELSNEFKRALTDTRLGRSRRDALKDPKFNKQPEIHQNCVRVFYAEGHHVDVPAYRKFDEGTDKERQAVEQDFESVQAWAKREHRPIYLGEFGTYEKGDMDSRVRWTAFIARQAERRGWSWAYWQFAGDFVLFDMASQQWVQPIRKALMPAQ